MTSKRIVKDFAEDSQVNNNNAEYEKATRQQA